MVKKVTGADFPVEEAGRRPGDAPVLIADSTRLKERTGWKPQHDDLAFIIRSAWEWERNLPVTNDETKVEEIPLALLPARNLLKSRIKATHQSGPADAHEY